MFALDLFNNDHERRLAEGAVDQLEQRRIDDLAMKMDDLVARAKNPAYKKNPAALAALMKEFQKCKAERDSYYKIRNETMGYGSLGETDDVPVGRMQPGTPEYAAARNRSVKYAGLPDVADKANKMARLNQPGKVGSDAVSPQQRVNPNPDKGIIGHAVDWLRGKGGPGKEGPTYEDLDEGAEDSKISIARYVYAQIMNALENNLQFATIQWPQGNMQGPKQDATLSRNQMHFLIQRLVSMSREQRKQFTHQVLTDRVATLQWLTNKKIKPAPTPPQPMVDPTQGSLPLGKPVGEARGQKKNSDKVDSPTAQNAEVQNRLRKLRAEYPSATNDVEALVQDEMATQARVDQILSQQQAEIQQQGSAVAQLNQANQQQDSKITSLQQQLATAQRDLQQPATKPTVATPTTTTTQPAPVADKSTSVSGPIYIPEPVTAKDQEIYDKVRDLETELKGKIDAMASWNAVAQKDPQANNELEALRKEVERTRTEIQRQVKKLTKQVKKHTKSLPATDQAPTKNMGAVRRVASTPQLGQTPTDAGELGRQIGQRAQANKQAKYGKKPTAPTTTDLDFLDTDQANQYLSRFAKNKQNATTVEPRQTELQIEEGTAEQFGQAVRQADLTGRELERDPEWRRLQQQKTQREKNLLRSQAGYGNDADEFGDITDMNETVKKLQQGDPITVTAPNEFEGATGEIYDFSPSRTFVIVDLYNHGKHSMHLSDVEYNQYAADQDDDEDDWYDDEELDEGAMSELDIERQDLDRMTDQQFLKAYGISKEFWKYKNQALLKKPRRRPMSAQLARSAVGQKMNTMYGSNCPGCGRSVNPDRCICESVVNPQSIIAQVTKILAGEARRFTNAPMAQLLAPIMKQYSLTLPQIDGMIPGGLKRAAGEYGIMMKEGWSDAIVSKRLGTPRTPYSVYIKGKKWKDFENDDHAEAVANKLRAKFKAEGRDPSVITIAPTDMSEATGDDKFDAMMDKISKDPWTQLNSDPNWEYEIEELVDQHIEPWLLAMEKSGMLITRDNETLNPGWRKRYEQISTQLAQKYLASKKFNPRDPDLVGKIRVAIDNHTDQSRNVHGQLSAYADDLPLHRYADAFDADGMTANIRDAMAGLAPRDDDDDSYASRPAANPRKLDPGNMEEAKADPTGSWIVYGGNKVMKFKTHAGAKAYAEKNGGKVASSEFYADRIQKSSVGEAIVASGPSKPLDDRAVRKMVWDTMKINADTGEQALQRALAVLSKKPQSRMVQDLQDKFQSLADRLAQGVSEGAMSNLHADLADVYNRMAPGIQRNRDSFKASQLYDALEAVAEQHGAEAEFNRMMNGARNRAHMDYDTNPGGFQNWFWYLPFEDEGVAEGLKSTLAGAALAGAMALGGAGAAQAQSASSGPNLANPTTIIQQIQSGKIQNQNDLASALGNASNKQAVFKILQNKAGLPGHGADSVINALGKKSAAGAQQPAAGAQPTVKSAGQSGSIIQRPTDNFEGRIKEEFDMPGTTIPLKSVIQGFTVFYNPKTREISITRGGDSAEAAIEQIRIKQPTMLAFKSAVERLINKIEDDQGITEAEKEPTTRQELLNRVDKIQRMMTQERNPANLQILRKELEMLKQRYQHLREDNDSEAVERAILNRIMVAHTDLLMKFGPDKVMQAAEEVAYNVGDVDEIGTSDVSAYVHQVKQILGVPEEVKEKWSQKYKSSINCANPKGFSQKAHCASKKK